MLAESEFGLASRSAALSFLISFGVTKAVANVVAGRLADRVGRKVILVSGWIAGLPVPVLIVLAPSWSWVVSANVLLGNSQGLCWSTTVIMKIDLVGPARRGLAMGRNEFAGYLAVAGSALATGYLAVAHGLRPSPFYPGIAFAIAGLALSALFARETQQYVQHEAAVSRRPGGRLFWTIFPTTSWKDRALFASSQAGMVNKLNDGMVWGLLPIFLSGQAVPLEWIGAITAIYPGVWGAGQLLTGAWSDRWGRKWMIAGGMVVQAIGIALFLVSTDLRVLAAGAVLLGWGTAMVYPTLLAAVSDVAGPEWRASAVGVYRLRRDGGYASCSAVRKGHPFVWCSWNRNTAARGPRLVTRAGSGKRLFPCERSYHGGLVVCGLLESRLAGRKLA